MAPAPSTAGDELVTGLVNEVGLVVDKHLVEVRNVHGCALGLALVVEGRKDLQHRCAHQRLKGWDVCAPREPLRGSHEAKLPLSDASLHRVTLVHSGDDIPLAKPELGERE